MRDFVYFFISGQDASKFLQGQITADVRTLSDSFLATAICNLKGRVSFGLWIQALDEGFGIVLAADVSAAFLQHIKKYAAFSKIHLSAAQNIYPAIIEGTPSFSLNAEQAAPWQDWAQLSIATGNYWLSAIHSDLYQPQELRLHQRAGVSYDKGCYLGQEIVARLYFKSAPKAYLHRVASDTPNLFTDKANTLDNIGIINVISTDTGQEALVITRPEHITTHGLTPLPLPEALSAAVGRQ